MSISRKTYAIRFTLRGSVIAFALMIFLSGCVTAPIGKLPANCSGVPGDFRTPDAGSSPSDETQGDRTSSRPINLTAIARPPSKTIPLLYIYGPDAEYVGSMHPYAKRLQDPVFVQAETEAYWGEVEDGGYYSVPWLDECSQAAMLDKPIDFRAPANGILFMQFVAASCDECDRITQAIERFIAQNPGTPVRWVRVTVPKSVGSLSK